MLLAKHVPLPPREEVDATFEVMPVFLAHEECDVQRLEPYEYRRSPQARRSLRDVGHGKEVPSRGATVAGGGGNGGVVLLEGEWHYGELVAPPAQPQGKNSESSWHDLNDVDERYRLPETDDDDSSISSYSAERTSSPRNVATSRAHSGGFTRSPPGAAYSARESKSSPLPTSPPPLSSHSSSGGSIAINGTRATFDRLQEYERYVDRCDEEGDWYHPNINTPTSPTADGDYDRMRRVRFLCDP